MEFILMDKVGYGCAGGRKGNKSDEVSNKDRKRNIRRIKKNARRLSFANQLGAAHLTLTYKAVRMDLDNTDKEFKKFIYELRQYYPWIKYLAVREIQKERLEKYGDEVIHYHILLNSKVDLRKVNLIWNKQFAKKPDHMKEGFKGFTFITPHKSTYEAITYVLKYITEEVEENIDKFTSDNGFTKKMYLCSQGLKKELDRKVGKIFIKNPSEGQAIFENYMSKILEGFYGLEKKWDFEYEMCIKEETDFQDGDFIKFRSVFLAKAI
jgi:hypothetical protein